MIKSLLKKIPFIGDLSVSIKRKILKEKGFETSEKYWTERYRSGGNSGAGSYNELAEFKGGVINSFVAKNNIKTVMEFGCGDGNQLKYFNFQSYIGYDVSPEAIKMCTEKFKADPSKQFKLLRDHTKNKAVLTLSLDVIYHLIEDDTYDNYMKELFEASDRYVIIYSSDNKNNERNPPHVKNRKFTNWVKSNKPEYKLIKHIPNKYPFNGDESATSIADFYIYELKNELF